MAQLSGYLLFFSIKVDQFEESFVCRLPLTCLLFPEKRAEEEMVEGIDAAMDGLGKLKEIIKQDPELVNTPETRMYGDCSNSSIKEIGHRSHIRTTGVNV